MQKYVIVILKMKTRDSNMELLRIVAMLLVMIVHADFMALGAPTMEDMSEAPMDTFMRYLIGGMSSVCVNVFVLTHPLPFPRVCKRYSDCCGTIHPVCFDHHLEWG